MKNTDYELQLLARIGTSKDSYFEFADLIHTGLFNKHSRVFDEMLKLIAENKEPTMHRLMNIMPDKQDQILDIFSNIDYSVTLPEIIDILQEDYRVRTINNGMMEAGMRATSTEKSESLANALLKLETNSNESKYKTLYEIALEEIDNLNKNINPGVLTGFKFIDGLSGGFQPSDLIIIAAETSQGKTSLSLSLAYNMINAGKSVAFISMEMSQAQISHRLMSYDTLRSWRCAKDNKEMFQAAADRYKNMQLHVADITNVSINNVIANIRSAKFRLGIDCVFIDYLQLIRDSKSQNREQEIGTIARGLKNLAKELNIPIVILSQLSRPKQGGNHMPGLSRLRDSGQIEEAADMVWFVYRPESYGIEQFEDQHTKELAVNIIAKGRNYGTGTFYTRFLESITRFRDDWDTAEPTGKIKPNKSFETDDIDEKEIPF